MKGEDSLCGRSYWWESPNKTVRDRHSAVWFYSIGLALGFFSYLVATRIFDKDPDKVLTGTPSGEHDANG